MTTRTIIALDEADYAVILQSSATAGVMGGAIDDAILAGCALKANVSKIYTWNIRCYSQFGLEVVRRLLTPSPWVDLAIGDDASASSS